MLELKNDTLQFTFPEVHPNAQLGMEFQRTLRIPDDGAQYPLPPGLGAFPLRHVDDFRDRVPAKWLQHGGVMLPMFQSEAMWLNFKTYPVGYGRPAYPFAIKVSAGKVSALTGDDWTSGLRLKDYCVAPNQRWIDGFVTAGGIVRQFVAAALGQGFTAEEQITGRADHGGIQIEIFPMKAEVYNRRFPPPVPREEKTKGGIYPAGLRRSLRGRAGGQSAQSYNSSDIRLGSATRGVQISESSSRGEESFSLSDDDDVNTDMGLAAGGTMLQQIADDPYGIQDWDTEHGARCFVHLANSMVWRAITKQNPPHPPLTASDYTRQGMPWYDHYNGDIAMLSGSHKTAALQSLMQLGFQKGVKTLPENTSVDFKSDQVHQLGVMARPDQVRSGNW